MQVKFYINFDHGIEDIHITNVFDFSPIPIERVSYIESSLEEELADKTHTTLPVDNWYLVTLEDRYTPDGSGNYTFDGYRLTSLVCCTKYF